MQMNHRCPVPGLDYMDPITGAELDEAPVCPGRAEHSLVDIAHPGRVLTHAGVATLGAGPALFLLGSVAFKLRVHGAYWRKRAIALVFVGGATALATAVPALAAWTVVLAILTGVAVAEARALRRI